MLTGKNQFLIYYSLFFCFLFPFSRRGMNSTAWGSCYPFGMKGFNVKYRIRNKECKKRNRLLIYCLTKTA